MEIHQLIQKSPEWLQFRFNHHGASEAAAVLGLSPNVKRTELLHVKHTGLPQEFSDWVQANILDYGHEVEAQARPLAEAIIGEELYPVTCSMGRISASCDGLTLGEEIAWEHKQWNEELAEIVRQGVVPEQHMPQCQQELMVTGAGKLLFMISDGTPERMVYCWVYPDTAWFQRLVAGWAQFEIDLENYTPVQYAEKPAAEVILALPALVVHTRGEVVRSNLPEFKAAAMVFIDSINTELTTDEDFANAEANVKFCDEAERSLEVTKGMVLSQAATIDDVMRTIDQVSAQFRTKRLALSKLVEKRKLEIKETILSTAKVAYGEHIASLEYEIAPIRLAHAVPDFAGAMKSKRTLASLNDAVNTALANGKIAANQTAADYRSRLNWYQGNAADYAFLFTDLQTIIAKPMDDFQLLIKSRIADHQRVEAEKAEALRARIEAEERTKAEAVAQATIAEAARLAKVETDRIATEAAQAERDRVNAETKRQLEAKAAEVSLQRAAAPAPGPALTRPAPVSTLPVRQPEGPPTLRLGQIGERLGFSLTADFVRTLGFEPAGRDKAAVLYHESSFVQICAALVAHIEAVQIAQAA